MSSCLADLSLWIGSGSVLNRLGLGGRLDLDRNLALVDLHLARLGFLGHRDLQGQDAVGVISSDLPDVQALAQGELASIRTVAALTANPAMILIVGVNLLLLALCADAQRPVVNINVDAVGINTGQVDLDDELIAIAVKIHRHGACLSGGSARELSKNAIHIAERIVNSAHDYSLCLQGACMTPT